MATMYVGPFTFGDVSDEQAVTALRAMLAALTAGTPYVHEFSERGRLSRYVAITPSVPLSADLDGAWPDETGTTTVPAVRAEVGDAPGRLRLGNRRFDGPLVEVVRTLDLAMAKLSGSRAAVLAIRPGDGSRETVLILTPGLLMAAEELASDAKPAHQAPTVSAAPDDVRSDSTSSRR